MKVALDTNILAYAEGINGSLMRNKALDLLRALPPGKVCIPVQVLGELLRVLVGKARRPATRARDAILSWRDSYATLDTTDSVVVTAADLSAQHNLRIWDAVILAAAAEGDCRLLLSEDLQDGFTWNGVTVANPFAEPRHPLLEGLLSEA
ncbi:MAG: PIN domain-containing protein [Vicinamibacterales bacterium]|nr:PIN domain-containing protein [Vicinamibacterales bacterium]